MVEDDQIEVVPAVPVAIFPQRIEAHVCRDAGGNDAHRLAQRAQVRRFVEQTLELWLEVARHERGRAEHENTNLTLRNPARKRPAAEPVDRCCGARVDERARIVRAESQSQADLEQPGHDAQANQHRAQVARPCLQSFLGSDVQAQLPHFAPDTHPRAAPNSVEALVYTAQLSCSVHVPSCICWA